MLDANQPSTLPGLCNDAMARSKAGLDAKGLLRDFAGRVLVLRANDCVAAMGACLSQRIRGSILARRATDSRA